MFYVKNDFSELVFGYRSNHNMLWFRRGVKAEIAEDAAISPPAAAVALTRAEKPAPFAQGPKGRTALWAAVGK